VPLKNQMKSHAALERTWLGESRITARRMPRMTPIAMAKIVILMVFSAPTRSAGRRGCFGLRPIASGVRQHVVGQHRGQHEQDGRGRPPPWMAQGHRPDLLRTVPLSALDCHRLAAAREPPSG